MKNRFSVIIASYNREKYIRQTIDSVLSQTFKDYEIIVVDDGSTDRTKDILQSYGAQIKNIHQENLGSEAAFRTGASLANGEYLAFLDSDDLFLPNALETYDKIIRALDSPPLIMGCMKRFWDGQDVPTNAGNVDAIEVLKYRDYLSKDIGMGMAQSIIVLLRSVFEEVSGARDHLADSYLFNYDYNLVLQAGTHEPCIIVKHPTTVAYRQHVTQASNKIEKMVQGVLSLIHMVRNGSCYGGHIRRFAKYAYLGGPVAEWSRKAFRSHQRLLAIKLLISGWPMIAAAALRKLWFSFHKSSPLIRVQ
jgi:glycosyltransferase involved in cell wall biosynthesis